MRFILGILLVLVLVTSASAGTGHGYINQGTFGTHRICVTIDGSEDIVQSSGPVVPEVTTTPRPYHILTQQPTLVPTKEITPDPLVPKVVPTPSTEPTPTPTKTVVPKPTKTPKVTLAPTPIPIPTPTATQIDVDPANLFSKIKGDGSDETEELQDALEYARDHNIRTIIFPKNKVIVISEMIRFYDKMTVIGNGATIKRKSGMGSHAGQMISVNPGCYVTGLIYDGNSEYVQAAGDGIFLNSNVVFDNNEVKNVREYSVVVYGGSNIQITNNRIHDGYQYGIATGGGVGGESHNITVTGNTIYNCQQVGIKIRGTHGAVIKNNKITMDEFDQFARGISLYSFDLPNDDILIDGNTITGSFEGGNMDGISSDNSQNTKIRITNNIVSKCDVGIDVHFSRGVITGNTISECARGLTNSGTGNTISNTIL